MSVQVQWRRGSTANHAGFTGATAEITVDTTKKVAVVHDGTTAGGTPLAKESDVTALQTGKVDKTSTTGSAKLPTGTTAQRDGSPQQGWTRFNTDTQRLEVYSGTAWIDPGQAIGGLYEFNNLF